VSEREREEERYPPRVLATVAVCDYGSYGGGGGLIKHTIADSRWIIVGE